jgi:hypothetical protein
MWIRGKVKPVWKDEYKHFNYVHKEAHPNDIEEWKRQGFDFKTYTGNMFANQEQMPNWVHDIAKQIGLTDCGFTFYKMKPGIIMPKHVDHFETYCKIYDCKKEDVWRAIVALEDWQSGHYFEILDYIVNSYDKGEYVLWSHECPHAAANIGTNTRYTLQITGKKL